MGTSHINDPAFEIGHAVVKLGNDIQEMIIAQSNPRGRAPTGQGGIGTVVSYDVEEVLSALCWAAANFIVQSGEFPTRHDRKRAAKVMERRLLAFFPQIESLLADFGPPTTPQ